jgi:hypothetical protein
MMAQAVKGNAGEKVYAPGCAVRASERAGMGAFGQGLHQAERAH